MTRETPENVMASLRALIEQERVSNEMPGEPPYTYATLTDRGCAMEAAADLLEQALDVLREVEWCGREAFNTESRRMESLCPCCERLEADTHEADCALARLIGAKVRK